MEAQQKGSARGLLVALLLSLLAGWPLLVGEGIINTRAGGDSPFLLVRLQQLVANLSLGIFPARWMPDAAYGLGYPFFNYYAHLPFYLAAFLKFWGVGYIWAIRLTQILGLLGCAAFMYLYLQRLKLGRVAATIGAVAYTFAPFHLVNLYVRGDSLSEFYAFLFYPLILWSLDRVKENPVPRRAATFALAYGGLLFTHNISALIFSPFLVLYILGLAFFQREGRRPFLRMSGLGLAMGLATTAFYWIPALGEGGYVHLQEATTGYFHYTNHFRDADLVQGSLIFDYGITPRKNPYALGLIQATATLVAGMLFLGRWLKARRIDFPEAIHLTILLGSTLLITSISRPFWDNLPLLPFVQFPWRFLSVQALATSVIIALAIEHSPWPRPGGALLGTLLVLSSLLGLRPEYLAIEESEVTAERLMLYEYFTTNIGSTVRAEYLPHEVETRPFTSPEMVIGDDPPLMVLAGELAQAELLWQRPDSQEWEIKVSSLSAELALPLYWFPGWQAYVDGQLAEAGPVEGLGYLGLSLEQGTHRLLLRLEKTPLRLWSEIISLFGLVVVTDLLLRGVSIPWRKLGGILALVILGGVLIRLLPSQSLASQAPLSDLSMDFARMPFLHHNPQGIRFEQGLRLMGYEFSAPEVWAGQELELTLHWNLEEAQQFEVEVSLATPAEQLFRARDFAAISRQPILEAATVHKLPVSPQAVPGLYLLRVRVFGKDGQLMPLTETGQSLGATYLQPVLVFNRRPVRGDEAVLASFGDAIRLLAMRAEIVSPQQIRLDVEWSAARPIPRNYALSFRFQGESEEVLFSRDLQPHYGFFPTSLWPPGELVFDSYTFRLPGDISREEIAAVELVVYRVEDLAPLGSYTFNLE